MTKIVVSEELAKQLAAADGPVSFVDATGAEIAYCTPVKFPHSPYPREEIERRREEIRKHPEKGRKLADFWKEIGQRGEGQS